MRFVAFALTLAIGCADENQTEPDCKTNERLFKHVCTERGPDDGCTAHADLCIQLCDGLTSCSVTSPDLRPLSGFPAGAGDLCVVCLQP